MWVHGSYDVDTYGVFMGYRDQPAHLSPPFASPNGRYLLLAAQDFEPIPGGNQITLPAGTTVLDGNVVMVYPHTGTQASVTDAFFAMSRGATVSVGTAQSMP